MSGSSTSPSWYAGPVAIALYTGGMITALFTLFFTWLTSDDLAIIQNEIKEQFDRQNTLFLSERRWEEESLSNLLGPIYLQFDRTYRACIRYQSSNEYIEVKVLREGNGIIRDLLLAKAHLIPRHLLGGASDLVEHYDRWIEEFEKRRPPNYYDLHAQFSWSGPIWVGPSGSPFPREAELGFRKAFDDLSAKLYPKRDEAKLKDQTQTESTPGSVSPIANRCYERLE
jgi:hypothetical protein